MAGQAEYAWAGEAAHMHFQQPVEFQKISSATIAYRKFDSGKPVIFLHGWPLAGVIFRKMIPFAQKDFTWYVPDLPGSWAFSRSGAGWRFFSDKPLIPNGPTLKP